MPAAHAREHTRTLARAHPTPRPAGARHARPAGWPRRRTRPKFGRTRPMFCSISADFEPRFDDPRTKWPNLAELGPSSVDSGPNSVHSKEIRSTPGHAWPQSVEFAASSVEVGSNITDIGSNSDSADIGQGRPNCGQVSRPDPTMMSTNVCTSLGKNTLNLENMVAHGSGTSTEKSRMVRAAIVHRGGITWASDTPHDLSAPAAKSANRILKRPCVTSFDVRTHTRLANARHFGIKQQRKKNPPGHMLQEDMGPMRASGMVRYSRQG